MGLYQHFRKHEHPFIDQVLSWINQVEQSFTPYITDFLDPREREIVSSLIGRTNEEVICEFFGGVDNVERKRAIIAPYYEEIKEEQFSIVLLEATFPKKFVTIAHRDILGAFSSLGIDRKKIGDIIVGKSSFQLMTTKELATYVIMNFTQVKNATIQLKEVNMLELLAKDEVWVERSLTVSSMRLDVIVKEVYQLSRKDAASLISKGRVKVNFTDVVDLATLVMKDDLISVRRHGRSKIIDIGGKTRKDKTRVTVARLTK